MIELKSSWSLVNCISWKSHGLLTLHRVGVYLHIRQNITENEPFYAGWFYKPVALKQQPIAQARSLSRKQFAVHLVKKKVLLLTFYSFVFSHWGEQNHEKRSSREFNLLSWASAAWEDGALPRISLLYQGFLGQVLQPLAPKILEKIAPQWET